MPSMVRKRTNGGDSPSGKRNKTSIGFKKAPTAVGAHISASKSASMRGQPRLEMHSIEVGMDSFYDDPAVAAANMVGYEISSRVMSTIQSRFTNEEGLRNCIYTELWKTHAIQFPQSAIASGLGAWLRRSVFKNEVYAEANFFVFALGGIRRNSFWKRTLREERLLHGLPVTTSSKPDATVIVEGKAHGKATPELVFGEFKNNANCCWADAIDQCTLYLYALLFWLCANFGLKVEAVYGFSFCGPKCRGQEDLYSVSLIKLSAPQSLNARLNVQVITKDGSLNEPLPLQFLIEFLKNGKRWK